MKKIFLLTLAAALLAVGCSKDETISVSKQKGEIAFSTFVDRSVRSIEDLSITTDNIEAFAVYGFATTPANEQTRNFDGVEVARFGNGWSYSPLQYWLADNTYSFGAIAPLSVVDMIDEESISGENNAVAMDINFVNDGATDLLYSAPSSVVAIDPITTMPPVQLIFEHQLAKVKFSFENAIEGYILKVNDIQLTTRENGTLSISAEGNQWSAADTESDVVLEFGDAVAITEVAPPAMAVATRAEEESGDTGDLGDEAGEESGEEEAPITDERPWFVLTDEIPFTEIFDSYYERFLIPADDTEIYAVQFTVEMIQNGVTLGTFTHDFTFTGIEFEKGLAYNLKAVISTGNVDPENGELQPIEFDVTIEEWDEGDSYTFLEDEEIEISEEDEIRPVGTI